LRLERYERHERDRAATSRAEEPCHGSQMNELVNS